mgnify:CR=1 FL=1
MRVAMYYNNRDVRVEELPIPAIGADEILMKVEASGICGSDVLEWYRVKKAPLVLGHEVAGTVEKIGEKVKKFKVGDRIVASHHVPCLTCHYCLNGRETVCETLRTTNFHPGGFAEYVRIPAINVERGIYNLPPDVSFEEGSFTEPLACVIRAQRTIGIPTGATVLVLGAGIAGILHIALAKALGAGKIIATDISEYRRKSAVRFGADLSLNPKAEIRNILKELNHGRLADRVIVCTGAINALKQAFECVDRGGIILLFASPGPDEVLPLNIENVFWRTEITVTSSYAGGPKDHITAIELIRAKRVPVREMITHILPLSEVQKGFTLVAQADESIKVIIKPHT